MERGGSFAQTSGWRATPERNAFMAFAGLFLAAAMAATVVGIASGGFFVSCFAVAAGGFGWVVSGLIPEPEPDVRSDIRRRIEAVRRYSGHPLPG